jgi:hypothetical protein
MLAFSWRADFADAHRPGSAETPSSKRAVQIDNYAVLGVPKYMATYVNKMDITCSGSQVDFVRTQSNCRLNRTSTLSFATQ